MALYQVQAPDGSVHAIEGPDDATPDEVMAQAQKMIPPPKPTPQQIVDAGQVGRFVHGVMNAPIGIGQLAEHGLGYATSLGGNYPNQVSNTFDSAANYVDQYAQQRAKDYEAAKYATGFKGADLMNILGGVMSPANAVVGKAVAGIPQASGWITKLLQNAGTGAAYGLTQPADNANQSYSDQKIDQAKSGAAFGVGSSIAGSALAGAISPNVTPQAQALADEGIRITPGQMSRGIGPDGERISNTWEDKATSLPFIGALIKGAQARSAEDLNVAAGNRALSPVGEELPKGTMGFDAVDYIQNKLGQKYDDIIPYISGNLNNPAQNSLGQNLVGSGPAPFTQRVSDLLNNNYYDMPEADKQRLGQIIQKELVDRVNPDGSFNGEQAKLVESRLGAKMSELGSNSDSDKRAMGNALGDIRDIFRDHLMATNPQAADQLQKINLGWANFKRFQDAVQSAGSNDGIFTANQLDAAVKRGDYSPDNAQYASGKALMQDLSRPARQVLPSKIGDSGTAGRELMAGGLGLAAGGAGAVTSNPLLGALGLGATGLYTRPGQELYRMMVLNRPAAAAPVANALRTVSSPADLSRLFFGP